MPSLRARRPDEELLLDDLAALVPTRTLQQAQDAFASALGMALVFTSPRGGPITKSDRIETFCWELTRQGQAKRPCANCGRLDRGISKMDAPQPFGCPMGLQDIAVPIKAGDLVVGYLITSQITTEPGAPRALAAARELGIASAAAVRYASRIPVMPTEQLVEVGEPLSHLAKVVSELASAARQNKLATVCDPLTGLVNRAYFWECLSRELEIAAAHNYPVSLLLLDLDDFRQINDTFGHATGDRVLQAVAQVLDREIRCSDLVGRYGSDAFLVMLRCTDPTGAEIVAWRLKNKIAACKLTARGQRVPVSASVGQVTYPICAARDPDAIFKELLAALQSARESAPPQERRKAA